MTGPRAALVGLVAVMVAACSGVPAARPSAIAQATMPPGAASPAVTEPPPTLAPSMHPSPQTAPKPSPVPHAPPKPSGVTFDESSEGTCTDDPREMCAIGDTVYTVSWKKPRTKGVEIRVYGLLECLSRPDDPPGSSEGPCLVKGTRLPASAKKLIAKAKASDGVVTWRSEPGSGDCDMAEQFIGPHEEIFYAIVLAAYNSAGKPSVFAIAAPGAWWTPDPGDLPC